MATQKPKAEPKPDFATTIAQGYAAEGAALDLGRGVHDGELVPDAAVRLPLKTSNRHGLITGATGTGKTKTLQLLTEQLCAACFVADVKGDVSGLSAPAEAGAPNAPDAPAPKRRGGGGADAVGDFLRSRQGKSLQRKVVRGVFGMLRKRL